MSVTQLTSRQIGSVQRNDFDITTTGQAVITKIIAGTNVTISSTGVDTGTGDVTVNTSGGYSVVTISSTTYNATQTSGSIVLLVDAATAGGAVTINLPTAIGNTAQFIIKKIDTGSNIVTTDAFSTQTIDGGLTAIIRVGYTSITIVNNNANWFVM